MSFCLWFSNFLISPHSAFPRVSDSILFLDTKHNLQHWQTQFIRKKKYASNRHFIIYSILKFSWFLIFDSNISALPSRPTVGQVSVIFCNYNVENYYFPLYECYNLDWDYSNRVRMWVGKSNKKKIQLMDNTWKWLWFCLLVVTVVCVCVLCVLAACLFWIKRPVAEQFIHV